MPEGINNRLGAIVHGQLAQDGGNVVLHRLVGDVEDAGDFLVRVAATESSHVVAH